jgi:hypothetical protein
MTKFIIILLAVYVLYYLGNIVYDLYLKKDTTIKAEESEEFSLSDFANENSAEVKDIGIEDVENLNTPKSFGKNEAVVMQNKNLSDENENIDFWREKFEAEESIDDFENQNDEDAEKPSENNGDVNFFQTENAQENANNVVETTNPKENKKRFKDILKDAATKVQMVENIDGHKTYKLV